MSIVRVEVETDSWEAREADSSDSWDRGDTEGHVAGVVAFELKDAKRPHVGTGSCGEKELPVRVGSRVWAVVAQYSTGDTFGRDGGQAQLLDVFASEDEAEGLLKACEEWNAKPSEGWIQAPFEYAGTAYYTAWTGYFESLDWIRVWPVVVGRARR